jgi:hypothetical protein
VENVPPHGRAAFKLVKAEGKKLERGYVLFAAFFLEHRKATPRAIVSKERIDAEANSGIEGVEVAVGLMDGSTVDSGLVEGVACDEGGGVGVFTWEDVGVGLGLIVVWEGVATGDAVGVGALVGVGVVVIIVVGLGLEVCMNVGVGVKVGIGVAVGGGDWVGAGVGEGVGADISGAAVLNEDKKGTKFTVPKLKSHPPS